MTQLGVRELPVTTVPLKEPFRTRAQLFLGDRLLANVRCLLSPPNSPLLGMALVPDEHDWLSLSPLKLQLENGTQYEIVPTKLERAPSAYVLLRFDVRQ